MKGYLARRLATVIMILAFALAAVACTGGGAQNTDSAGGGTGQTNGTDAGEKSIRILLGAEPFTIDPITTSGTPEQNVLINVMEGLFTTGENLEIVPVLAESYEIIDELTWEFKLREGIKFHNGNPFNAEVVKFSYELTMEDRATNSWADDVNIEEIEVVDEYTVRFHTSDPTPHMLARLANDHYMMDPEYYTENGEDVLSRSAMGTGPYKLARWDAGNQIVLEANEDYWGGAPEIKEIVFRFVTEEGTRVAELQAGNADIAFPISPDNFSVINSDDNLELVTPPGVRRVYMGIRTKPDTLPTSKKEIRQALNYGLDIETISKALFDGMVERMQSPINPPNNNPNVRKYTYDPEKAKQLMAQAGYPDGFSITIDAYLGELTKDREFLQAIQDSYRQVGINVNLNIMEKADFNATMEDKRTNELFMRSSGPGFDPYVDMRLFDPGHKNNATEWAPEEFVEAFEGTKTIVDPEKRREASYKAQELIMEDAPWIFLWNEVSTVAISTRVKGFDPQGDERIRVNQLDIE